MSWNSKHVNEVKHPGNPELEQALGAFRDQYRWYEQQMKYRRKGIDTDPCQAAWNYYLKLRKQHEVNK